MPSDPKSSMNLKHKRHEQNDTNISESNYLSQRLTENKTKQTEKNCHLIDTGTKIRMAAEFSFKTMKAK